MGAMHHSLTSPPFFGDYDTPEAWGMALDEWHEQHQTELHQANLDYASSPIYKILFWLKPPKIKVPTKNEFYKKILPPIPEGSNKLGEE